MRERWERDPDYRPPALTPRIALASAVIVGAVALIISARIRQRRPPPVPEGTA